MIKNPSNPPATPTSQSESAPTGGTLLSEAKTLAMGPLFRVAPNDLALKGQVVVFQVYKVLKDQLEAQISEYREPLLATVEAQGTDKETGKSRVLDVDGSELSRVNAKGRLNDSKIDKLSDLLKSKGIPVEEGFDPKWAPNPSKLEDLVRLGRISQQELDGIYGTDTRLNVSSSKELGEVLDHLKRMLRGEILVEESFELPPAAPPAKRGGKRK